MPSLKVEFFKFFGSVALVRWPWFGGLGFVIVPFASARNGGRTAISRFTYSRKAMTGESFYPAKDVSCELFLISSRIL